MLALPKNLFGAKHSSLLVSDEEKKFYNFDTWRNFDGADADTFWKHFL
jgi:hypothetical protein